MPAAGSCLQVFHDNLWSVFILFRRAGKQLEEAGAVGRGGGDGSLPSVTSQTPVRGPAGPAADTGMQTQPQAVWLSLQLPLAGL